MTKNEQWVEARKAIIRELLADQGLGEPRYISALRGPVHPETEAKPYNGLAGFVYFGETVLDGPAFHIIKRPTGIRLDRISDERVAELRALCGK
jgi:hypothetical protein